MNRSEWFLSFMDAACAPAHDQPSGALADHAEWLSVFLTAASASPARSGNAQNDAEQDAIEHLSEEKPVEKSVGRQAVASDDGQAPEAQPKDPGEEQRRMHGGAK
jgi:hypothetical protein